VYTGCVLVRGGTGARRLYPVAAGYCTTRHYPVSHRLSLPGGLSLPEAAITIAGTKTPTLNPKRPTTRPISPLRKINSTEKVEKKLKKSPSGKLSLPVS